jgi:hypothetical protein
MNYLVDRYRLYSKLPLDKYFIIYLLICVSLSKEGKGSLTLVQHLGLLQTHHYTPFIAETSQVPPLMMLLLLLLLHLL